MIDRSVLVHYRTEEAKAYRREHGDRGRVQIRRQVSPPKSVAVEQFDNNSNKRQPIMLNIHLIHEARTEHAKAVRRLTGTNDFRDKEWHLRQGCVMQCVGTSLTTDNLIAICYD